jgi:hypothetical protein
MNNFFFGIVSAFATAVLIASVGIGITGIWSQNSKQSKCLAFKVGQTTQAFCCPQTWNGGPTVCVSTGFTCGSTTYTTSQQCQSNCETAEKGFRGDCVTAQNNGNATGKPVQGTGWKAVLLTCNTVKTGSCKTVQVVNNAAEWYCTPNVATETNYNCGQYNSGMTCTPQSH